MKDILDQHSSTLKSLYLVNCELEHHVLLSIASRCKQLEKLAVKIPLKDVVSTIKIHWTQSLTSFHQFLFAEALSRSQSLRILHDMTELHTHGTQFFLSKSNVRLIMDEVPTLNKLISEGRTWTVSPGLSFGSELMSDIPFPEFNM